MRMSGLGRVLFAIGFAATGALTIVTRDFAIVWRPVAPWHDAPAIVSGILLFVSALALVFPPTVEAGALALAGFLFLRELSLQVPGVFAHPLVEASWYSVSEDLVLLAGAWTIFSLLPPDQGRLTKYRQARAGQFLFALALPAIGLSHMIYIGQTAPLIPPWLPFHVPLAYFTGVAHIATGAAILFNVLARLAATLEAVMVSLFTLLVWVPLVGASPANRFDWSEICVSTAIAGSAWAVAESFRGRLFATGAANYRQHRPKDI